MDDILTLLCNIPFYIKCCIVSLIKFAFRPVMEVTQPKVCFFQYGSMKPRPLKEN